MECHPRKLSKIKGETMSWYKISLTNEQVTDQEMFNIQHRFRELFMKTGGPKDMALFCSASPVSKEEFAIIYFSPSCSPVTDLIIAQYWGEPCEKPAKDVVALLMGHADAWDLLD